MKKNIKRILKISVSSGMILFLLLTSVTPASAWDLGNFGSGALRSMTSIATQRAISVTLNSFGLEKAELNYMGEMVNVSRQKKMPPQVALTFDPADPVEGEKVTAVATPTYFMNSLDDLYFTWFLKMDDCDASKNPSGAKKEKCDLNADGKIDVEDWKIKAMRIIVNDDFNWEGANYNSSSDSDGYDAIQGGDDQDGRNAYCYMHDVESGEEYEIDCGHLFPDARGEETGDGSFGANEEKFWRTDPHTDDTAHTGNVDEANVAGLGINTFTWNYSYGDEVGVVVEGVSVEPTHKDDSSYKTMWGASNGLCEDKSIGIKDFGNLVDPFITGPTVSLDDFTKTGSTTYTYETERLVSSVADNPVVGQRIDIYRHYEETLTIAGEVGNMHSEQHLIQRKYVIETETLAEPETDPYSPTNDQNEVVYDYYDMSIKLDGITLEDESGNIDEVSDLNKCLEDSLVSPAENGLQSQKLDVSLSYTPSSPINDSASYDNPSLSEGDELNILASVQNAKDPNYVQYSWQVYQAGEVNPDSWGSPITKSRLPDVSQMVGLGVNSLKFRLNFPSPDKYLRVKVTAKENVGRDLFREGHADVVIPVNSTTNRLRAYDTDVTNADSPRISQGQEICKEGEEKAVCPVAKNQIVAVATTSSGLTDYMWTIDGKPFVYESCFFEGCEESKQSNTAVFPILKEKGEKYSVSLVATDSVSGRKVNLSRTFEVIEPIVKIMSADESICKPVLLGSYIDLDGKEWKDYSELNFWALTSGSFKLKPRTIGFETNPLNFVWSVDGDPITKGNIDQYNADREALNQGGSSLPTDRFALDDNGVLTVPAKMAGESYNIALSTVYTQSDLVKKALNKYWNVPYDQFYEKIISGNAVINMQDVKPEITQIGSDKIFAMAYAGLPSYLAFLLRVVLSGFLILFCARFIFVFFPKIRQE